MSLPRSKRWCRPTLIRRVLTSMSGIWVPAAVGFLAEPLGKTSRHRSPPVPYVGLALVTRRSGSLIRGKYVSHGGNKWLKRDMFLSVFASLRFDPVSQVQYPRKRGQDK
ncbi:transposase [Schaalia sp. HMT-877]|nr:transposase [Schaalia sp. HMT-877]